MPAPRPRGRPRGPAITTIRVQIATTKKLLNDLMASSGAETFDDLIFDIARALRPEDRALLRKHARQRRAEKRRRSQNG